MKKVPVFSVFISLGLLWLSGCERHISQKVAVADIAGVWVCQDPPDDLCQTLAPLSIGEIILFPDGSFKADNFPLDDPLRLINEHGEWEIVEPSSTPGGRWSVSLVNNQRGVFLTIKKEGSALVLSYTVDVLRGYRIKYKRQILNKPLNS